jgi:anti-sigma-K factor RskA
LRVGPRKSRRNRFLQRAVNRAPTADKDEARGTKELPSSGRAQRKQSLFMMNNTTGWMGGWAGGGMWIWAVIGVAVVVLLVVVISKLSKK